MSDDLGLRERKKRETRRHLAETALGLFLERGFDEVSVAEVAAAAGVSKMTVFNHFPAKEDLVFGVGEEEDNGLPDLAAAVRARAAGVSPFAAIRVAAREDFAGRAGKRDVDAATPFIRMVFRSPTLMHGFGRRWAVLQQELAGALAEAAGIDAPPPDLEARFFDAIRGDADLRQLGTWLDRIDGAALTPHLVAGQVVTVLQQLTMVNLVRVVAGVSRQEGLRRSLAELDAAFDLLERGMGGFAA
ncbi:MAG: TetR family transcriptional regulator [Patulibacter minatonensis]